LLTYEHPHTWDVRIHDGVEIEIDDERKFLPSPSV